MSADSFHALVEIAMKAKKRYDFMDFEQCVSKNGITVEMTVDNFFDFKNHLGIGKDRKYGKECYACKEKNHFARAPICKAKGSNREDRQEHKHQNSKKGPYTAKKIITLRKVKQTSTLDLWVPIKDKVNKVNMFIDSGFDHTINPMNQ